MPGELKSPPTWNLEVGGTSTLQAQLPARLKSPPLQAQVWGGSRWADLALSTNICPSLSVVNEYNNLHIKWKYFLVPECLLAWMDVQVLIVAAKCTKCLHCSARAGLGWAGAEDLLSSRLHPRPLVQLPGESRARYNANPPSGVWDKMSRRLSD